MNTVILTIVTPDTATVRRNRYTNAVEIIGITLADLRGLHESIGRQIEKIVGQEQWEPL